MAEKLFLHLPKTKPIDIDFEDISYVVKDDLSKEKKLILKGVSGNFKSGELTAIMGPSGAGKSSLLNIITGYQTTGVEGRIQCSGVTQMMHKRNLFRKDSCYIMQDDSLPPLFTAAEMMALATDLKLGPTYLDKAGSLPVNDILEALGLDLVRDMACGRLSGGQKKRLSIAIELVDNPPVMFLDEPTTGLDISSSLQCLSALKSLARAGRTIICTIHQPSYSLLKMFDHVYILAAGQCVYQGATGNMLNFLQTLGFSCPKYHNPADFMIEVVSGEFGLFTSELEGATRENCWRNMSITENQTICKRESKDGLEFSKTAVRKHPPTEHTKFWILVNRCFIQMYRDWKLTHIKFAMHLLVAVLVGLFYDGSGQDASKTFSNLGYLFCTSVYLSYTTMMPAVLRFPLEMTILKREYFNNWYCIKTYFLAICLANAPIQILMCLLHVTVSYFMSMQSSEVLRYLMFITICVLITLVAESIGLLLGTIFNTVNGTFFGSILTAFFMLFSGFLALFSHMPGFVYWVTYLNFMRFGQAGLVLSVYGYDRGKLPCPEDTVYCHLQDSHSILKEVGMDDQEYWVNAVVLCVFLIVLRLLTYFCLCKCIKSS